MSDLGQWHVWPADDADYVIVKFAVISESGAKEFMTSMLVHEAREFASTILSLTDGA